MNPFEFLRELYNAKTRVLELSVNELEDFLILASVVLTECQRVTDAGWTDG